MTRSNLIRRFIPLALFFVFAPLQVHAEQSDYWLKKMADAVHKLNYDGYFVYLHDNSIESLRTVHSYENGRESERLFSQNGEARELLRDEDSVTRITPRKKHISTEKRPLNRRSFSSFFRLNAEEIGKNYQLKFQGKERVADRLANIIVFKPSDNLRYGYRVYMDDESGFPLQWEMFNSNQELVSSIMFTNISIDKPESVAEDKTTIEKAAVAEHSTRTRSTSSLNNGWTFSEIPKGYSIKHFSTRRGPMQDNKMQHFLFSDGLSSFSVYIEGSDKARLKGKAKLGALNAYGVFIDGYQLTAVGEVPLEALVFIDLSRNKTDNP